MYLLFIPGGADKLSDLIPPHQRRHKTLGLAALETHPAVSSSKHTKRTLNHGVEINVRIQSCNQKQYLRYNCSANTTILMFKIYLFTIL